MNLIRSQLMPAIALVFSSLLSGCNDSVLDLRNAQIVNGKVYQADANEPFSGTLTNLPASQLFNQQPGFRQVANAISNTGALMSTSARALQSFGGLSNASVLLPKALCAVSIKNGATDGKATCTAPQSDVVRIKATFSSAALAGDFTLYDETGKRPLITASFVEGRPDGALNIYSPSTGNLIHTVSWQKGVLAGEEKAFDETTGNQAMAATLVDGRYEGDFVRYAPDGKRVVYDVKYSNGLMEGEEKAFDPATGALIGQAEYLHGKLQGTTKRWKSDGRLIFEKRYEAGQEVPASDSIKACVEQHRLKDNSAASFYVAQNDEWEAQCEEFGKAGDDASGVATSSTAEASASEANNSSCVESWAAAFHREQGEDAVVAVEQIEEWKSWCSEGKRP